MSHYIIDIKTPAQGEAQSVKSHYSLSNHGLRNLNNVYWNLPTEALYEEIIFRREGRMSHLGPIAVDTGPKKARSANDKFVVREAENEANVWWGEYNRPFSEDRFDAVFHRMQGFLQGRDLFVRDCYAGADPNYRLPVRIITEYAWHSLFVRNMFIEATSHEELRQFVPEFTVISIPSFKGTPEIDGTLSETFILLNFSHSNFNQPLLSDCA